MSEQHYGEKYEKEEEKDEKEHEKEEKTWDEKWRHDPLGAFTWATILVWAGVVLLVGNMGLLANLGGLDAWGLVFAGAGLILFMEVFVRLLVPSYRRPVGGSFIFAAVLLGIGLGKMLNTDLVWPLVLIAIGLSVLVRGFLRGH